MYLKQQVYHEFFNNVSSNTDSKLAEFRILFHLSYPVLFYTAILAFYLLLLIPAWYLDKK